MSNPSQPNDEARDQGWLSLPNLLTILRILGSPVMVVLAAIGQPIWLGVLVFILVMTEWLDGLLARRLHQESAVGARLDTVADAIFYTSLVATALVFNPTIIKRELPWIAAVGVGYLLSWLTSWIKFGRLPSYHTWMSKRAWMIVGIGTLCLFTQWSPLTFRITMLYVVLTNLEAILITLILPQCKVNVFSLWHALREGK